MQPHSTEFRQVSYVMINDRHPCMNIQMELLVNYLDVLEKQYSVNSFEGTDTNTYLFFLLFSLLPSILNSFPCDLIK